MKIGIRLASFGLPFRKALQHAEHMGVVGVLFDAVGEFAPAKLSQSARRELRRILNTHDLELSAVGCPLPLGLDIAENLEPRLDYVKQVMTLAYDLGPRLITLQAGCVSGPVDDPRHNLLRESLAALGNYGDRMGTIIALETGLDAGDTMAAFLDEFDTGSLAVNFDPANLFLNGFRPIDDLRAFAERVVHVQAKDARRHGATRRVQEVPLGHGELDWMLMAEMLGEMDYRGFIVAMRDAGSKRIAELGEEIKMLRRIV